MSETMSNAVVGSPDAVRIRAFLRSADALGAGTILDRDRVDRLRRDLDAIDSISTQQGRRHEHLTYESSMRRRHAVLERSMANQEYNRLEVEYRDRRAALAEAEDRRAREDARREEAAAQLRKADAEYVTAAESYDRLRGTWLGPLYAEVSGEMLTDRPGAARQRLRDAEEQARDTARRAENMRAECDALHAQLAEVVGRVRACDETVARVDAAARTAPYAMATANAAQQFCTEMTLFLGAREDRGLRAGDVVARLDSGIEVFTDDGPEETTGRAVLERLAALADDDVE